MPVARRATPPTSQIREQLSVLNALSAWTDEGAEEKQAKKKHGYEKLAGGGEETWKDRLTEWFDPEGDKFNVVIGLVIIGNAITIGFETEYGAEGFVAFEHVFNITFFIEMCLRIRLMGKEYFSEPWNVFDFTLVTIGTLDLWILPLLTIRGGGLHDVTALRMLRMVRLVRVLRVIRLFRMFHHLYLIMQAFGKAFQIVLLMGVLVLILDYVCAIMLTQGIGQHAEMWEGEDSQKIKQWFGTIPGSMQTLFLVMTLTGWEDISITLVKQMPPGVVYPSIVLYIMVTAYTMLSLITGIISESLITAQQEFRLRKEKMIEDKKKEISFDLRTFLLNDAIDEKDRDIYNNVNVEELKPFLSGDADLLMKLASISVHMTEQGVLALIDKLADPATHLVNIDYFVDKLTNLVGGATASSIMDLKFDIAKLNIKLDAVMDHLGITIDSKKHVETKQQAPVATHVNAAAYNNGTMASRTSATKSSGVGKSMSHAKFAE